MTESGKPAFVAVDWGTSHLRVWALSSSGDVQGERKSGEGMASTPRDRFADILERHLEALSVPAAVPVVMCGMVGSRQGWAEAGYIPVPAPLQAIAENAVRIPGIRRDVRILPGFSKTDTRSPDVMRGEETQLLGLSRLSTLDNGVSRVICMPGTHSKWVQMNGDKVATFVTFMTGDLFSVAAQHSVLRHMTGSEPIDPASPVFRDAVAASLRSPTDISARLFSIRSAGLLLDLSPAEARARLSGYLIGQEIAGALTRFSLSGEIDLVGGGVLGGLYREALAVAGVGCRIHDGDALAIAGLREAASVLWKQEPV
ncbi:2-dehydro-3-deoxygalactonokinase [Oricola cellulosilytica]|uniref:2-dehydro-3-deoxygalactonokinase n=1 Tax=Oricola cellulosilytica TaxID=1429082 RepID=UPI001304F9A6|nr:2-dehydro-3-deoxygalactonokinase [Oricola cellulosilytica]